MEHTYVAVIIESLEHYLTLEMATASSKPWRFPGGKPEKDELPIAAAARELKEELGIEALSLYFVGTSSAAVDGIECTGYYFQCDQYIGTPEIKEPAKHKSWRWLTTQELHQYKAHPEFDVVMELC